MHARRGGAAVFVAVLAGCLGLGAGSKYFKKGEDAQKAGDLEEAHRNYKAASEAEPKNERYRQAIDDTGKELSREHRAEARAKEKAQDWAAASAAWGRAAEFAPSEREYQVRRDLSGAKAQNLGPDEWYEALKGIAAKYEGDEVVARSLEGARAQAYQYNVNLAKQFLGSGEGARAHTYFERARSIDPTTPGMPPDSLARAEALSMAEEANAKLEAGDAVGAYELYQKAYEKVPLPEIKRDMAKAKTRASAILSKLEGARAAAKRKRFSEALRIYGTILDMEGAPPFIEEEASQVRYELIAEMVAEATNKAEKKLLRPAHKILVDALTYANLGRVERDTYKTAIDHARDGRPKTAVEVLDKVGLETSSPLYTAARALAVGAAREQLTNAERTAKKSAEKALEILAEIEPFEKELDGINELKRTLRSGSFLELLDEALAEAKKGDAAEAASLLMAALNASQAPTNMRDPAAEGCDALKDGRFGAAQQSFDRALAAAPRSKMAQRGVEIAKLLRQSGEREALEALKSGRGDQERAVATLEDAIAAEPNNKSAKEAAKLLLSRAKSGSDADAGKLIVWAGRLSRSPKGVEEGASKLAQSDHAGAEAAFASVKRDDVAEAGREIARSRMLAALSSGAKAASKGDESSARALAKLLEKDPQNREAQSAVKALLEQASQHGSKQEDTEAARFLGLATIATSPAPGVKKELDRANSALAKGDVGTAEKAYADALDLEPENKVAAVGYEIARKARVGMLSSAIADAKSSGNMERAAEALKKTLEVDPNSAEAKKAFAELIEAAKEQGAAGNDAQAAALLEVANVVSKPETAKKKIGEAIALIKKGEHEKAIAAFDEITKNADSQVAAAGKEVASARKSSVLVEEVKGLETGSDPTRGAMAARRLRELDPASSPAKRAIDAALARAENAAAGGDDRTAARELKAVSVALDEESAAKPAIVKLETGRHQEAEEAFGYSQSALALAGQKIARGRRMGTLRAGLSGQGEEAAKAIAALLKADPNNKEAKKAFDQLLEEAKKAAKSADDVTAADKIKMASIAANAPDELSAAIDSGASHLAAARHAEAEKAFVEANGVSKDSKVAKVGLEVARQRRLSAEKDARTGIAKAGDPRPHAKVLQTSLLVEPQSRTVSQAVAELSQRARKSAKAGDDAQTAQVLEALALLENGGSEVQVKLTEASGLYATGSFEQAETMFAAVDGGSKIGELGRELARARRVALLETEWKSAKTDKDVLRESGIVRQILEIDPNHREAKVAASRVQKEVGSNRIDAAKSNKEMGKLGVAFVYLERALKLNEGDAQAKKEMEDVTAKLKDKLDLILLVEPVTRAKDVGAKPCLGFDEMLRDEISSVSSKRTDLGGFVLSPSWTQAVEEKSDKAPEVSGGIAVEVTKCKTTPREGNATFTWSLQVPRKGSPAARGEVTADVPNGLIPRDEQDEAGNNAKQALAARATTAFLESLENERDAIDLWLLTLAEHAMAEKDTALAADAYARLTIKAPRSIAPQRLAKVEEYLSKELR